MAVHPGEAEAHPGLDQVTVIVVTFNSAHCLPSLQTLLDHCPELIVVDNGSNDGSPTTTKQLLPHARVLALPRNVGFGAANNRALAQVTTPYALLLNPDCDLAPVALQQLVDTARTHPSAAVIAPQLTDAGGRLETNYRWSQLYWESKGPAADGPVCVGFVCGAAMLWRMSAFAQLGFFDERFFLYYEDDDLCLRLLQHKQSILLIPSIQAVHRSRGSVKGKQPLNNEYLRGYHHAQSKLTFTEKHRSCNEATSQRKRLIWLTILGLPLRLLLVSPRLSARMFGRLRGAFEWTSHA